MKDKIIFFDMESSANQSASKDLLQTLTNQIKATIEKHSKNEKLVANLQGLQLELGKDPANCEKVIFDRINHYNRASQTNLRVNKDRSDFYGFLTQLAKFNQLKQPEAVKKTQLIPPAAASSSTPDNLPTSSLDRNTPKTSDKKEKTHHKSASKAEQANGQKSGHKHRNKKSHDKKTAAKAGSVTKAPETTSPAPTAISGLSTPAPQQDSNELLNNSDLLNTEATDTPIKPSMVPQFYAHHQGARFHFFTAKVDPAKEYKLIDDYEKLLEGDALKTAVLERFAQKLQESADVAQCKQDLEASEEYQIISTGQGLFTRAFCMRTDSVKAFEDMAASISSSRM